MKISVHTVNPFQENTYLVSQGHDAVVVDPGFFNSAEFIAFRSQLEQEDVKLKAVLLTHAHVDHILGLQRVIDHFDVPVYLSHQDLYHWENYMSQAALFGFQVTPFNTMPADYPGEKLEIGELKFSILTTPGHAPEHISLYVPEYDLLIAGDTLFRESVGRTDLYEGDFELLEQIIREKLYVLPGSTRVLPGHGPETTIGHEIKHNPFVKGF